MASEGRGWPGLALAAVAAYVVFLLCGWLLNAPVGHDGVLRPHPHDLAADQPSFTILEVESGSPADRAGLQAGDAVLSVDNWPVDTEAGLSHQAYHNRRAGQTGVLRVQHSGAATEERVEMVLQSRLTMFGLVSGLLAASAVGLFVLAVGSALVYLRPRLVAARLLLLFSLGLAVFIASDLWHWTQSDARRADQVEMLCNVGMLLGSVALLHLFLTFPMPQPAYTRLLARGNRPLGRIGGALSVLYALPVLVLVGGMLDPSGFGWEAPIVSTLVILLSGLAALVYQYRHPATATARAQLTWVVLALAVAVAATFARVVGALTLPWGLPALVDALLSATWLLFPLSISLAVLRYRLFDVDRVARATLTWGLLAGLLLGAYLTVVLVGARFAVTVVGPGATADPTLSVVAALVVAVVAYPARLYLRQVLDRKLFRDRRVRRRCLEEAADVLGQPCSLERLAQYLSQEIPAQLRLTRGWLGLPGSRGGLLGDAESGLSPLVCLASNALISRLAASQRPTLLARAEDRDAYAAVSWVAAEDPALSPWYAAGARILIPLRTEPRPGSPVEHSLLGVWAVGGRTDGDLFEREDLALLERVARLAVLVLERLVLRHDQTPTQSLEPAFAQAATRRSPLTARESEVARLVAQGYANRQIAQVLVISERTAEGHVERIRDKLDVRSRAEIAAWAVRHGLVPTADPSTGTVLG